MASQSHFNSYQARVTGESPSVPLSVYRDLAGELQAARALASVLRGKNQQLKQHNRELQQEIDTLAAVTDRIRALAQRSEGELERSEVSLPMSPVSLEDSAPAAASTAKATAPTPTVKLAPVPAATGTRSAGWGLAAVTLAIALLFAGLGFMALRPLTLPQQTPQQDRPL